MATLPSNASLTGATTTNAQQKTNFTSILSFMTDLLGTDSSNKTAARAALGVPAVTDFAAVKTTTGYQKLPGGLIIQWGQIGTSTTGTVVTFPIVFPNAIFAIVAGTTNVSIPAAAYVAVQNYNTSTFNISANAATPVANWVAFGY